MKFMTHILTIVVMIMAMGAAGCSGGSSTPAPIDESGEEEITGGGSGGGSGLTELTLSEFSYDLAHTTGIASHETRVIQQACA